MLSNLNEILPATTEYLDISKLQPGNKYGKQTLARLWGFDRRTLYTWHKLAIKYVPGYCQGFQGTRILAECPDCKHQTVIDDLQRIRLKRPNYGYMCPRCFQDEKKPLVKTQQHTRKRLHLTTNQAKVLRLVGGLIQKHGKAYTQIILTTSWEKEHRELRTFLKTINWEKK